MPPLFLTGTLITVVALAVVLVAEARQSRPGIYVFKPLASIGFLLAAWAMDPLASRYGTAILVGLGLGFAGDVLLMGRSRLPFLSGLVAFLLGHVAYVAAFLLRGVEALPTVVGGLCLLGIAIPIGRWLWPNLDAGMRTPVLAYIAVITVMVAAAVGTFAHLPSGLLLVGATAFYLSDLSVARDRFVTRSFVNRLWGLPCYYLGQLLLAASLEAA